MLFWGNAYCFVVSKCEEPRARFRPLDCVSVSEWTAALVSADLALLLSSPGQVEGCNDYGSCNANTGSDCHPREWRILLGDVFEVKEEWVRGPERVQASGRVRTPVPP